MYQLPMRDVSIMYGKHWSWIHSVFTCLTDAMKSPFKWWQCLRPAWVLTTCICHCTVHELHHLNFYPWSKTCSIYFAFLWILLRFPPPPIFIGPSYSFYELHASLAKLFKVIFILTSAVAAALHLSSPEGSGDACPRVGRAQSSESLSSPSASQHLLSHGCSSIAAHMQTPGTHLESRPACSAALDLALGLYKAGLPVPSASPSAGL